MFDLAVYPVPMVFLRYADLPILSLLASPHSTAVLEPIVRAFERSRRGPSYSDGKVGTFGLAGTFT